KKCLKIASKNGKGKVGVVLPADLSHQPESGKRYFLVRWKAKTTGGAEVALAVNGNRTRSQSMQSDRWIEADAPIEPTFKVTDLALVMTATQPGDAIWVDSVSAQSLSQKGYQKCFVNDEWPIVPDEEAAARARSSSSEAQGNVLVNGDFELGPHAGRQVFRISRGGNDLNSEQHYQGRYGASGRGFETIYYHFEPERLYTMSVYAKGQKEGAKLTVRVVSGCNKAVGRITYPENPNRAEARVTFPVTTDWQRYHFSFMTAPDPDREFLKPMRPASQDAEKIRLMYLIATDDMRGFAMNPKSAFKVMMETRRAFDLSVDETDPQESIPVWIDCVQLEQGPLTGYGTATVNTAGIDLERSETNDYVYYDDETIECTGKICTEDATPRELALKYEITDFFWRPVRKIERTVATGGSTTIEDKFSFASPGRGLHCITVTVNDPQSTRGAREVKSLQQAFCAFSREPRGRPFDEEAHYGIHSPARRVHMEGWESIWANEYERMRKVGVKWIRYMGGAGDTLSWAYVEPEKGKWQWDDATLDHPAQKEFRILGSLYTVPSWLGGGWHIMDVQGHWEEWEEYVFQVVSHYKGRIKCWEVWNEPHPSIDIYSKLLETAARAAKRADPECKVAAFGGLTHPNSPVYLDSHTDPVCDGYKPYVKGVLDRVGVANIDMISVHGYYVVRPEENWWPMSERLTFFRDEMAKRGKVLPIWDSETAGACDLFYTDRLAGADNFWNREIGASGGHIGLLSWVMDPRTGANWMAQTLAVYLAHGCEKTFYHFNSCGPGNMDGNAGVLYEYDHSPKAHCAAWGAAALMLDRAKSVTEIDYGKDVRCYVYDQEDTPVAAYWRLIGDPESAAETLSAACSEGELELFDIMSNPLYGVKREGGRISIPLTSDLAYIRGKGVSMDRFVEILKSGKRSGREQKLKDWSFLFGKSTGEEAAKETRTSQKENPIRPSKRAKIRIDGKMEDWQGVEPFEVKTVSQVVIGQPVAGLPAGVQKAWNGEGDLSYRLYTAWDEDNFYWAVLVKDDVVVENPYRGKPQCYEGDCVEVFLDVRERSKQVIPEYDDLVGQILVTPATAEHPSASVGPASRRNIVSGMKAASSVTDAGYFVEGAIPVRDLLPGGLGQGQVIGFDVAVDDTDSAANRKTQMNWAGTRDAHRDASVFGRLQLVD
ncbi:MAG: sugar-binding protein, partial [Planctomycetota bacterium]